MNDLFISSLINKAHCVVGLKLFAQIIGSLNEEPGIIFGSAKQLHYRKAELLQVIRYV